ncbi:hypothetical protein [Daejeonella sp.]|uniref:hypothetical protein n=1 Tax=Daejeonella sp. TaxID=2805397 RepID=UPI0030C37E22
MARIKKNVLVQGLSGQISKQVVLKTYGDKTFLSSYPDMSNVTFNESQKAEQSLFARAIAYAKSIIRDPQKKAAFQATIEPGRKVYNAAISAYLKEHKNNNG